jgi:hypothetical protein
VIANVDGLRVSLAVEGAPPARPAAVLARLAVELPDGSALVAVELTGDEVARLLAGETLAVPGYVAPAALVNVQPAEPVEPEPVEPEPGDRVQAEQLYEPPLPDVVETPGPATAVYGSNLDDPPAGTEPIARPAQVDPPQRIVAYVDGWWRDALVVSRGPRTALVAYVVDGPFADRLRRVTFDRMRRLRDNDE